MGKLSLIVVLFSMIFLSCREGLVEYSELDKENGAIFLDSYPRGAEIFLKDTKTELTTPEEFEELQPGEYIFTLRLNGYEDTTIVAKVESGKNRFFSINLKRLL